MKVLRSSHQNLDDFSMWGVEDSSDRLCRSAHARCSLPRMLSGFKRNHETYHSASGYFRIAFRITSTFSQDSLHS